MTHKLKNNYTKDVLTLLWKFRSHNRFTNQGIWQRDWEPSGNLTLQASGVWLQNFHRAGERDSWRAQQNLVCTRTQKKGAVTPQETDTDWPVHACESLGEARVDSGLPQGQRHWQQQSWEASISLFEGVPITTLPLPQFGLRLTYREGTKPHPSAENWIKDLLSMALTTRTRPSFHQSVPPIRKLAQASYPQPPEGR